MGTDFDALKRSVAEQERSAFFERLKRQAVEETHATLLGHRAAQFHRGSVFSIGNDDMRREAHWIAARYERGR